MSRIRRSRSLRRVGLMLVVVAGCLAAVPPASAIVGGTAAEPGRWPWMAALLTREIDDAGVALNCSAFVIAPRRVLTAAHCLEAATARDVDVLVGRTRLSERNGQRIPVTAISVFPEAASGRAPGLEAAVLTLRRDAGVPALPLAAPGQEAQWAPGTTAWAIGWGRLTASVSPGGFEYYADRLRELSQPIQGDDACEGAYGTGWPDYPYRPAWLLCSGAPNDRAGTCYGDSGSPLVVGGPAQPLAVGIDVGGDSCARPGYFDLNIRVDRISGWALSARMIARPEFTRAPRITGALQVGRRVQCAPGRWQHRTSRVTIRWRRLGKDGRVVGTRATRRVTRRDVASGLVCEVTASNAGGSSTANAVLRRR